MSWRVALGVPLTVIVSVRVLGGGKVEMVWALTGNLDLRWRFWRVVYGGGKVVEGEGSGVCSIAVRVGWGWGGGVGMSSMVSVLGRRYFAHGSVSG